MTDYFYRFGLALGIGILVGLQREYAYDEPEGRLFAGVRTFALISMAGCTAALAAEQLGSAVVFAGITLVFGCLVGVAYYVDAAKGKPGLTTEMAAIVTFVTGAMCYWELFTLAAAVTVVTAVLLSLKHELRAFAHHLTREDVYATLKFAVISVIVLPLLPNRTFGPEPVNVLNPNSIWLMVVFISGISFLGYVMIKVVGAKRGIGLTGLLGGIASSTAVTLSFSQRSRDNAKLARPFALAIIVAWTVMYVRVVAVIFALSRPLANRLLLPMSISMVSGLVYCGYLYFAQRSTAKEDMQFSNPFELGPAIKFGIVYAVVLIISKAAQYYFGDTGVYVSSFVSGLADVDAIALSMVDLTAAANPLDLGVAARAIVLATLSNTLFKGGFALTSGSPALRRALWPGLALMIVTGVAAILVLT